MTNKHLVPARLGFVILHVCLAVMVTACGLASGPAPATRAMAAKPLAPRADGSGKADVAPDFALPDSQGHLVRLAALLPTREAVVLVYYHSRYCQLCLNLLVDLERHRADFELRGAQIVAVASQSADDAASTSVATSAQYPILADVDRRLATQYGVRPFLPGRVKGGQAPVSVFIIGQSGQLVWKSSAVLGTSSLSSEVILANLPGAVSSK